MIEKWMHEPANAVVSTSLENADGIAHYLYRGGLTKLEWMAGTLMAGMLANPTKMKKIEDAEDFVLWQASNLLKACREAEKPTERNSDGE